MIGAPANWMNGTAASTPMMMHVTTGVCSDGLTFAIAFDKGCYTGQEAVAMATYRGHVSKKLCGLALSADTVPSRGDIVQKEGKEVGFITSALQSSTLGSVIALAYVKYGFFEIGNSLDVMSAFGLTPALIVELPFFKEPKEIL